MFTPELVKRFRTLETPFFYYDMSLLQRTLSVIKLAAIDRGFHVHYAMKANCNQEILTSMKQAGLGIDAVSGNEVKLAIEQGFDPSQIAFAGVGKTDKEINYALEQGIFCFNCESGQEIEVINQLATAQNVNARIALRINPNLDPKTHKFITTGLEENKFGINPWELDEVMKVIRESNQLELVGLHFHIGSQVMDTSRYQLLCEKVNEIQNWFEEREIPISIINVGGGLGIDYNRPDEHDIPELQSYFDIFSKHLHLREGQELHFELGRSIVGQCGNIISRVLYTKPARKTTFAIIDAGMTELIRPALYQAYHQIDNLTSEGQEQTYDIVGPICETSDAFLRGIQMKGLERGDLVAIRSAGAYGEVMASNYNLREKANSYYSSDAIFSAST